MAEPGTILGDKYRLLSQIGEGGMATVWLAVNIALERTVAVKFITRFAPNQRERFLLEAKVAASIHHRNVIDILDFGVSDEGEAYMVLEYMEGKTLAERMTQPPALTLGEIVNIAVLTLSGLSAVHNADVVHRDLKPENIFLVEDEDGWYPKLLDFGVSKSTAKESTDSRGTPLTQEGMLVGTPQYMAPEQARGLRDVDVRADLWSMGIVLYELITGELPFDSENIGDVLLLVMTKEIMPLHEVRPEIGPEISAVVMKALERDRENRWQTAREMRAAILDAAAALGDAAGMWGRITPGAGQGQLSDPNLTPISGLIQIAAVEAARSAVIAAQRSARADDDTQDTDVVAGELRAPTPSSLPRAKTPTRPGQLPPSTTSRAATPSTTPRAPTPSTTPRSPARPPPGPPPPRPPPSPRGPPAAARPPNRSADAYAATIPPVASTPPVAPAVPVVAALASPAGDEASISIDLPLGDVDAAAQRDLASTAPPLPGEGVAPEGRSHAGAWLFALIALLGLGAAGAYVMRPEWFASLLGGAPPPIDAGIDVWEDAGPDAGEVDAAPELDAMSVGAGLDRGVDANVVIDAGPDAVTLDAGELNGGELDAGELEGDDAGEELDDAGRHGRPTKIRRPPIRRHPVRHPPPRWHRPR